jgi:hypothetical protein
MQPDSSRERRAAPLVTPSDLKSNAPKDLTGPLNTLAADVFDVCGFSMKLSARSEHEPTDRR